MKVVYWSDYSCPFCYIGEARLKKAAEEAGVNIVPEMKAFQLDPTAGLHAEGDTVTRFAKKYGLSMESAAHRIDMISEMGRGEGIDFRYATTLFTNRKLYFSRRKQRPADTEHYGTGFHSAR